MNCFNMVFHNIPRQGPGCDSATTRAWKIVSRLVPSNPRILDIGCGSGASTMCLAKFGNTDITALDNDPALLHILDEKAIDAGLPGVVQTVEGSMMELPFEPASFDLIWSEGAIFVIGFERGLREWKGLLRPGGMMVLSELSWLREYPDTEVRNYFDRVYPDIRTVGDCGTIAERIGYKVVETFELPADGWMKNYYNPIEEQIIMLERNYLNSEGAVELIAELREEIAMYKKYHDDFGYVFYILKMV